MSEPIKLNPGDKIEVKDKTYMVLINNNSLDVRNKPIAFIKEVNS